jgi:PAS domain S-box-containing protein
MSSDKNINRNSDYIIKLQDRLITLASNYISLPAENLDDALQATLADLGPFVEADRLYFFDYNWEANTCTNTHEWCGPGIEPQIHLLSDLKLDIFGDWVNIHMKGEVAQINDVTKMDEADQFKHVLLEQNIKSILMVPMMNRGTCIGFLGIDMVNRQHDFSTEEVRLLSVLADLIVSVRNRMESDVSLRERMKELNCIYSISSLSEDKSQSEAAYFQEVVTVIPPGFQIPDRTWACISFEGEQYLSAGFTETTNFIASDILVSGEKLGHLMVYSDPEVHFYREEVALLEGIRNNIERFIETRRALNAIQKNEQELQNLVNSQTSYVLRTDMEGRHTYWNSKFEEDFGWVYRDYGLNQSDSLLSICDYHHQRTIDIVEKCVQSPGITFKVELDKPELNGGIRTTLWEFICLTDSQGNPSEIQCMGIDITDRTRAERQLRESEQELRKFRIISDQANYGTAITTMDGTVTYCNDFFARMHGYTPEELQGKSITVFHQESQMPRVAQLLEVIQQKGGFSSEEVSRVHKDGTVFPSLMSAKIIRDEDGSPMFMSATVIDVTDIKQAEKEVARLSTAVEQSSMAIVITDLDGNIQYASPGFVKITGYSVDEVIGQNTRILKSGKTPERIYAEMWYTIKTGRTWKGSWINRRKNGEHFWESVTITPLLDDENNVNSYMAVKEDITERVRAETEIRDLNMNLERKIEERTRDLELSNLELEMARVEAETANRSKSEFLSRMSHELRTPMNSILGFAQLLEMGELNDAQKKGVGHILRSGRHLLDLINEILDISRIESGTISLSVEPVEVFPVAQEMIDSVMPFAGSKNISLILDNPETAKLFVNADRQRLKQVLLNLINNAIKYNSEGGEVRVEASIFSNTNADDQQVISDEHEEVLKSYVRISVKDNGVGIAEENLPKIFDPFERIGAENSPTEGTGLGLAVVQKLMQIMGGLIGVESTLGEGSHFWIELERCYPQVNGLKSSDLKGLDAGTDTHVAGTILYIEDNVSNIELIDQVLSSSRPGLHLVTNMYGSQALSLAKQLKPQLILLDLNLPDIHGSEALEQLLADDETRTIPVVVISADAMQRQLDRLMDAGARDYLTKPIDIKSFLEVVDRYFPHT